MANENRHTNTGRGYFDRRVDNFFRLSDHFPFFFSGTVFHKCINMRDHIESDLLWKCFGRYIAGGIIDCFCLIPKLVHARFSGT